MAPKGPSELGKLDRRAAIHDHLETGGQRALGGRLVDDAELEPYRARPEGDRLVDVGARAIGAAEDVDDLDAFGGGDLGHAVIATFAEELVDHRIDGYDPVAVGLKQARDAM